MIPPPQRGRKTSRPGRPSRQPSSGDTRTSTSASSNSSNRIATQSNDCVTSDEPVEIHNSNTNILDDYMFQTSIETNPMHTTTQLLDFSSLVTGTTTGTGMIPGHFSMTDPTPTLGDLDTFFGTNHNNDVMDMGTFHGLHGQGECTCHAGVTELLASMRGASSSNDQRLSLDAQLARLKQCIVSSEESMGCIHSRDDSEPIHIMAVTMLIGYVIDDFKMLANESTVRRGSSFSSSSSVADFASLGNKSSVATPSSTTTSLGDIIEPRLSWGVFELEEDDEMDLRQRLYLLSFRKLERLLSQLTLHLRDQHNALASLPDPSRHMAFVIACDYARLWLERKAGDVKRLFSFHTTDEIMNSVLV
ncbi:uncharacterized protein N7473_008857 [Penicillium subrubescens]|nr:uncharacterized protein N7473_008857 [Penicillium subrubescens]KAJ5886183.1 hypothetical protein N7473_008857 [Penicillium subrubescens]